MTIEESTATQSLYTELRDHASKLKICDPTPNRYLSEVSKTDKIDAKKTCPNAKSKPIKRSFLFRSRGQDHKKETFCSNVDGEQFVLKNLGAQIQVYEAQKKNMIKSSSGCLKNTVGFGY